MNQGLLLDLRKNTPTRTSADISLDSYELNQLLQALETNTTVIDLTLHGNPDTNKAEKFARLLHKNKHITSIIFNFTEINDEIFEIFATAVLNSQTIKIFIIKQSDNAAKNTHSYTSYSSPYSQRVKKLTLRSFKIISQLIERNNLHTLLFDSAILEERLNTDIIDNALYKADQLKNLTLGNYEDVNDCFNNINSLFKLEISKEKITTIKVLKIWRHPALIKRLIALITNKSDLITLDFSDKHAEEKRNVHDYSYDSYYSSSKRKAQLAALSHEHFLAILENIKNHTQLINLDLSNNDLTDESLLALTKYPNILNLQKINLSGNKFTDKAVMEFAEFIKQISQSIEIIFNQNPLTIVSIYKLAITAKNNSNLKFVFYGGLLNTYTDCQKFIVLQGSQQVGNISVCKTWIPFLTKLLANIIGKQHQLTALSFNSVALHDKNFALIIEKIKNLKQLATLDLSNNELSDESLLMLTTCPNLLSLRKINLSGNKFNDKSIIAFAKFIVQVTHPIEIIIDQNSYMYEGAYELAQVTIANPHIQIVLGKPDAVVQKELAELSKPNCQIFKFKILPQWLDPAAFCVLLIIIAKHTEIEDIDISGSLFNYQDDPKLYDKSAVKCGDSCLREMIKILKDHNNLLSLDLSNNRLPNSFMSVLVEFLKTKNVAFLYLAGNQFTDESITSFSDFLGQDNKLVRLDIRGNQIKNISTLALAKALSMNKTLTHFNMDDCPIESEYITTFLKELLNSSIIELNMPYKKTSTHTHTNYQRQWMTTQTLNPPAKLTKLLTNNKKNCAEMILAITKGDLPEVKKLIGYKVSPYVTDENLNTLLHIAARKNYFQLVKFFLLEMSVNRRIRNAQDQRAEDLARETKNPQLIELFTQQTPPPKPIPVQKKVLDLFKRKQPDEEQQSKNNIEQLLDPMDASGAPAPGLLLSVPDITDNEKNKRKKIAPDENKCLQLYFAALNGEDDRVAQLFKEIPIDTKIISGETALHAAVKGGHISTARLLLANSASVNSVNDLQQTPLHLACDFANTCLMLPVVSELINLPQCNVNLLDRFGKSPLFNIVGGFTNAPDTKVNNKDKVEIVWQLIKKGADANISLFDFATFIENTTPLHKVVIRGEYKMMVALLSASDININAVNGRGRTALHEASELRLVDIIDRLLIEPELDLTIRDGQNQTPLEIAQQQCNTLEDIEQQKAMQIKDKITRRMNQRLVSKIPSIYFVKSLDVMYGKRGQNPTVISGDKEHNHLKNATSKVAEGNQLTASLTFLVRHTDRSRHQIIINLQGKEFHATHTWKQRVEIGRGPDKRLRSPDARDRIYQRYDQAPETITAKSSDKQVPTLPLAKNAIHTLFNTTNVNPSFEQLFHHSEQALLDFLEDPTTIEIIVKQLRESAVFRQGCKVYPTLILRIFSTYYLCPNCEVGIMGEQNPKLSAFLNRLGLKLKEIECQLSLHSPLRMMVCISASTPAAYTTTFKNEESHEELFLDLRAGYKFTILQRTFEPVQDIRRFVSRKPT